MQTINIRHLLSCSKNKEVRPVHIILGNRALNKFGEIDNVFNVSYHPQFNAADELSFVVYQKTNDKECFLWDEIKSLKTVWVKEYDEWFEISVEIDESELVTKKIITATSLCEAELSQTKLYNIDINTEEEINNDSDYEPTIFYNADNPKRSLLHRILDKAPNYTIGEVDKSLWNIQRTFSADNTDIYTFLTSTVSQEIGCIFLFDSERRIINVYDTENWCLDCGYRDADFTTCPECGSSSVKQLYGKDTTIYIDKTSIANDLKLTPDDSSVKNCMVIKGGDEVVDAVVRKINPSGSNYIYYFNEDIKSDMPEELTDKLEEFNNNVEYEKTQNIYNLEENLVQQYNYILNNVKELFDNPPDYTLPYSEISTQITGYPNLITAQYDVQDFSSFLKTSMMPVWHMKSTTAKTELNKLESLSIVAVNDISTASASTVDSAVLTMAKAIINTGKYKISIISSSYSKEFGSWSGKFEIKSYTTEEDIATSIGDIIVAVNDDRKTYIEQKTKKTMAKIEDTLIQDLYDIEDDEGFKSELKKYSVFRLEGFRESILAGLTILQEQGCSDENSDMYDIYSKYYNREGYVENELNSRNLEVETVTKLADNIITIEQDIQDKLNLEKYLGEELWKLFVCYRREEVYQNDNYISDGLTNAELVELAQELYNVAQKEIIKSGEKQYSISSILSNLLLIKDEDGNCVFEPILDDFSFGNYIRCKIDGKVYKMRLSDATIDYDNLDKLSVNFYDFDTHKTTISKASEILEKASSIAGSYNAVTRQANKGEKASQSIDKLRKEGLDSAQYNVYSTDSTVAMDRNGLLARNYDDVTDEYSNEQLRLSGSNIILTDDNWKTTRAAIGKQKYTLNGQTKETWGVNADTCIASDIIGGDIYSANYQTDENGNIVGNHFDLNNSNFELADGKMSYNSDTNTLNLKGVTLDWSSSNKPQVKDVEGLEKELEETKDNIGTLSKAIQATQIGEDYVISPKIGGGYLQISDEEHGSVVIDPKGTTGSEYIFNVTNKDNKVVMGVDTKGNGKFTGEITASKFNGGSLLIGKEDEQDSDYAKITEEGKLFAKGAKFTEVNIEGGSLLIGQKDETESTYAEIGTDGKLIAQGADIKGNINATSGKIGAWNISEDTSSMGALYSENILNGYRYTVWINQVQNNTSTDGEPNNWVYSIQKSTEPVDPNDTTETIKKSHGIWYVLADGNMHFRTYENIGIHFWGSEGREIEILRDGIDLYFQPNNQQLTHIGKGSISINKKGTDYYGSSGSVALWTNGGRCIFNCENFDWGVEIYGNQYMEGDQHIQGDLLVTGTINSYSSAVSSSDKNAKYDIAPLDKEKIADFVYSLKPSEFRLKTGTSKRLHHGLIAQDVKESMGDNDWGLYIDNSINNPNYNKTPEIIKEKSEEDIARFGLRYEELIPDLISTIQLQKEKIDILEKKIEDISFKLNTLN